jgi:hypothetical protein
LQLNEADADAEIAVKVFGFPSTAVFGKFCAAGTHSIIDRTTWYWYSNGAFDVGPTATALTRLALITRAGVSVGIDTLQLVHAIESRPSRSPDENGTSIALKAAT